MKTLIRDEQRNPLDICLKQIKHLTGYPLIELSIRDLCANLHYLEPEQMMQVIDSCAYGALAHSADFRKSGEPYITHPIAVAEILSEYQVGFEALVSAVLHDTVEDTDVTLSDLSVRYGQTVAQLVDGVTKLKLSSDKNQNKAATFRKILTATLTDARVMVVKLADRLHNMSTMEAIRPDKRQSTAEETLEFYLPFARVLGLNALADQVELLCYENLDPEQYGFFAGQWSHGALKRKHRISQLKQYFAAKLTQLDIQGSVLAEDHRVDLCRAFFTNKKPLETLLNSYRFTIIVPQVLDCDALAASLKHYLVRPIQIQDHIRRPNPGGTQSLNLFFERQGEHLELVIQTQIMFDVAKRGAILADLAPESSRSILNASLSNLSELVDPECAMTTAQDMFEYFRQKKVWAYTPAGGVIELPRGATYLDFAYAVSPFIGNHALKVRVDSKLMSLADKVVTGQTITVLTDPLAVPNAEWLGFLVTKKARRALQQWLSTQSYEEQLKGGEEALSRALELSGDLVLSDQNWRDILKWQQTQDKSLVYQRIATGDLLPQLVVTRVISAYPEQSLSDKALISGTQGVELFFAKCCNPVFGDPIYGHLTRRGTTVHRRKCHSIQEALVNQSHLILDLEWGVNHNNQSIFQCMLEVKKKMTSEALSSILLALKQLDIGVLSTQSSEQSTFLLLGLTGRERIVRAIKAIRSQLDYPEIRRLYEFNFSVLDTDFDI